MSTTVDVYLHPGEVHVSARECVITTILGSCVSVCITDAGTMVGGMNHFLLPEQLSGDASPMRYAHGAMDTLINRLVAHGGCKSRFTAKLFGGANVLHAFQDGVRHIGAANVAIARTLLARHGIPISAEDVGGTRGRRLVFSAHDGAASVRRLGP